MKFRNIRLFVKTNKRILTYLSKRINSFYYNYRGCLGQGYRVLVKYWDNKNEYRKEDKDLLSNDSGWYTNKSELTRTVRMFLKETK